VRALPFLITVVAAVVAACGPPAGYAQVEVWNRTLSRIWLIDQDGKRLDVAACGYAITPAFRVNRYDVWSDAGHYFRTETGGPGPYRNERLIVLSPSKGMSLGLAPLDTFPAMPRCEGHPTLEGAPEQP
jgi:hypothetical protein